MVMQFTSIVLSSSLSIHTLKIFGQNHPMPHTWPIVWLKYSHLKRVNHMQICFCWGFWLCECISMTFAYDIMWPIPNGLSLNMFVYVGPYGFEGNKYITCESWLL